MNNNEPHDQEAQTVSHVERQFAEFAESLRRTCARASQLPADQLRHVLATIDATMIQQADYEHAAGSEWLSPYYFELADEVNTMRAQIAQALSAATTDDTASVILSYLAEGRNLLMEGEAVLSRVREGERPPSSARKVYDGVLPYIEQARAFARTDEYAASRVPLERLADDLEALRAEAWALL